MLRDDNECLENAVAIVGRVLKPETLQVINDRAHVTNKLAAATFLDFEETRDSMVGCASSCVFTLYISFVFTLLTFELGFMMIFEQNEEVKKKNTSPVVYCFSLRVLQRKNRRIRRSCFVECAANALQFMAQFHVVLELICDAWAWNHEVPTMMNTYSCTKSS
jgi:hypothetical protein